jgi:hypothetical protein
MKASVKNSRAFLSDNNFMSMLSVNDGANLVYPALLSDVSQQFRVTVPSKVHIKDSIEYKDSFTGYEAVVCLPILFQILHPNSIPQKNASEHIV